VNDIENQQMLVEYLVNDNVREARQHQFTGIFNSPRAAAVRHRAQALDSDLDHSRNVVRGFQAAILLDVFRNRFQI
jgi:hypothetical protein